MTAPLTALLERVEAAEEGSRELDARIWQVMSPDQKVLFDGGDVRTRRPAEYGRLADFPLEGFGDWDGIAGHIGAPNLTASIDAALALVERVLPGLGIVVCRIAGKPGLMQIREAFVFDECVDLEIEPDGWWRIRPAALAIVECLIRALHALASRDAAGLPDGTGV